MADDGGLGEARARAAERESRARLERAAEVARKEQDIAAYRNAVAAALREQDDRMSKAVPAFLDAAREIPPNHEEYVVVKDRGVFRRREKREYRPEGHRVLQEGNTVGDNEYEYQSVVVGLDGVVRFRQAFPRIPGWRARLASDAPWRPVFELDETPSEYHPTDVAYSRRAAAPGTLPFFITGKRTQLGGTDIRPLSVATTEPGALPELIERTTPWFLDLLAVYLGGPRD